MWMSVVGMLTNVGEVRMMETQQLDWPQGHLFGAYLSRNEEDIHRCAKDSQ